MVRTRGPNNSWHNWLDMAFRGFSEKAREEFLDNQQYEKDIRDGRRGHRRSRKSKTTHTPATPVAIQPMQGLIPKAQNAPQGTIGNSSPGPLSPAGSQQGLASLSNIRPAGLQGNGQAPAYAIQNPRDQRAGSTAMALAQLQNISPDNPPAREPQGSNRQNSRQSAMPATEAAHASTARVPTEKADLLDIERTHLEGMAAPSAYVLSRRSRR